MCKRNTEFQAVNCDLLGICFPSHLNLVPVLPLELKFYFVSTKATPIPVTQLQTCENSTRNQNQFTLILIHELRQVRNFIADYQISKVWSNLLDNLGRLVESKRIKISFQIALSFNNNRYHFCLKKFPLAVLAQKSSSQKKCFQ